MPLQIDSETEKREQLYRRMARLQEERRRALAWQAPEIRHEKKPLRGAVSAPVWRRLVRSAREWLMHPLINIRNPTSLSL